MRAWNGAVIGLAVCGLALGGCQVRTSTTSDTATGSSPQEIKEAQPTTTKVDVRNIVGYRLMSGSLFIPPDAQAMVYSTGTAPIQDIVVKVGDRVNRGQVMMTLASPGAQDYASAKSTYDAALAAYNQALAQYEVPVKQAQQQLDQARSTERTVRQSTTPGGDATALQQANQSRKALETAVQTAKAQAQANELPYKQQLDQAKAALAAAQTSKNSGKVTAPITGTVATISTTTGQQPTPQTVLAKIVDMRAFSVKATVPPSEQPYVKVGTPVVIMFNDLPNHGVDGRVRSVKALPAGSDGSVQYEATIDFNNSDGLVKPNMVVDTVGVLIGKHSNVLAVPVDAVGKDTSGKPYVKVLEHGQWQVHPVTLGLSDGYYVEIKSGVERGDSVQVVPGQGKWLMTTNLTAS